jgi:deoxyribodipyrimidine photolyase-related protein
LVLVLGDQLDGASAAFDGFDPNTDAVLQMEVREEASYIPQHKRRLVFFFSAMRHFRDAQRAAGRRVLYSETSRNALDATLPHRLSCEPARLTCIVWPNRSVTRSIMLMRITLKA